MTRAEGQLRSATPWSGQPSRDRLEFGLVAGYVIIAIIAVITGAKGKIGEGLSKFIPAPPPPSSPHEFVPSILDLLRSSADFIAAAALLIIAGLILYRRGRNRTRLDVEPATKRRFELPFLF